MPAFFLNPWVIGSTIAIFSIFEYNKDPKGTVQNGTFIGPIYDVQDPSSVNTSMDGLTRDKWDDALLGVVILGLVLFSKPWK
jgi:hypothetical protein